MATLDRAREAKTVLRREIAGRTGVTGIGLARTRPAGRATPGPDTSAQEDWVLRVNVASADVPVPATVDGVDVEVRVVGVVTASS
ncbi:hypothetical protein [Cellulosimicrobium cellulans]|uniref:hypothetical protein n=1 Tax=Cellulosimicrobium cellulans TaxID=1710 RepID=UPI0008496303|nr:hypothetical protein [Cellulosimicrobium cellulans]